MEKISVFWFRRDLRITDNHGFYKALRGDHPVLPIFIFDPNILDKLEDKDDARVTFIHQLLSNIQGELRKRHKGLKIFNSTPEEAFKELLEEYDIAEVFTNKDYEPYALKRDGIIRGILAEAGVKFSTFKDHVLLEQNEVTKDDGNPYVVYTPYSKKWRSAKTDETFAEYKSQNELGNCFTIDTNLPSLKDIGFKESDQKVPDFDISKDLIKHYGDTRNIPSKAGTSRLSPHLRFGSISIREVARETAKISDTFLNELIWRDFYSQILWHFPKVVDTSFREKYDRIQWRNNEKEFKKWCEGNTGFPIVDAGMRELNETGWMHNRVRMITASFLCKDLLIDWRWGEAYFARKLLDYDLASNNGGWQWAAGSGTDAAPYFRIFNPESQQKKFDPNGKYIKKYIPELDEVGAYPEPIVNHKEARERCLKVYKDALN